MSENTWPVVRSGKRLEIGGPIRGLNEYTHGGHDTFPRVGKLIRHVHKEAFEFCLILRGRVTWHVRNRPYELRGGDVFMTRPGEPHGGAYDLMHPCVIGWIGLIVPEARSRDASQFLSLPAGEARELCRRLHGLSHRRLRGAGRLEPFLETFFQALSEAGPLAVPFARAALQQFLIALLSLPHGDGDAGFIPPGLVRAREFLDGCPHPWPDVAELADLAGLSVSHFHASFLRHIGLAPMEYAHRQRLERAERMLSEPRVRVTDVALRLGYCSSQHLAACFRRYLGRTPTQRDRQRS